MNVVLITTGDRPRLLRQSIESLYRNAVEWGNHTLTVVADGWDGFAEVLPEFVQLPDSGFTSVWSMVRQGASASRNIGASSIPKYRRQEHVMFVDDDVYMMPGWDTALAKVFDAAPMIEGERGLVVSGHAHPFNHSIGRYVFGGEGKRVPMFGAGVLSTVHMAMPWWIWDKVGWFVEPGGAGGSEDVEWCRRATNKGMGLAVTDPMCVVHCGLTSSSGRRIVGYELMVELNDRLIREYGLDGKVLVV